MDKYIITKSNLVADILKKTGYTILSEKDGSWTFLNDGRQNLSADQKKDVVFSNKMFL